MNLVKGYMKNDELRHGLNTLTEVTFGFHFEDWVTNGYFEGDYIPYSLEENGKIISNVSANIMQFEQNGTIKNYIQIGTVMTDEKYRKQGFARQLMEHVIREYEGKCDGIYLFGDLDALDFYRKLGFKEKLQGFYVLREDYPKHRQGEGFQLLDAKDEAAKKRYMEAVRSSISYGAFEQVNKYGLQMFYTAGLENVYYAKDLDCYMVMYKEDETVEIQSIIAQKYIPMGQILEAIPVEYAHLRLGFTPRKEELDLFTCFMYDGGEDYRLFCRGEQLDSIETEKLYFPAFSHA